MSCGEAQSRAEQSTVTRLQERAVSLMPVLLMRAGALQLLWCFHRETAEE